MSRVHQKPASFRLTMSGPEGASIDEIKKANIDNQMKFVDDAAKQGVQMLCFQEIFTTPYFCRRAADALVRRRREEFPMGRQSS